MQRAELERRLDNVRIPFIRLPVWHRIKFLRKDPVTDKNSTADSIHCRPSQIQKRGILPGRFDTALVNDGTGEDTGVEGSGLLIILASRPRLIYSLLGYHICRVRVVFSLPKNSLSVLFNPGIEAHEHLAYVQWFSPLSNPDPNHGLYKVSPKKNTDGSFVCSIIPVANIRRSVHLFPRFGQFAPKEWTSTNVLDSCNTFFVNSFTDRHLYRILY